MQGTLYVHCTQCGTEVAIFHFDTATLTSGPIRAKRERAIIERMEKHRPECPHYRKAVLSSE